jgi:hypothetical protein
VAVLLAGCAASPSGPAAANSAAGSAAAASVTAANAAARAAAVKLAAAKTAAEVAAEKAEAAQRAVLASTPRVLPVAAAGAGRLPQDEKFPSTHDAAFRDAMADVWLAVTTDRPDYARPAFFPEAAYEQVKAIAYPAADWTDRLWYDFELDIHAAHEYTGSSARLLRVEMAPDWEAAWVPPGYCYNSSGYWHINGARLVYERDGQERSIGIASLISWRGVWYVVHFGGVVRPAIGLVDDPESGPGYPGPAGGCLSRSRKFTQKALLESCITMHNDHIVACMFQAPGGPSCPGTSAGMLCSN